MDKINMHKKHDFATDVKKSYISFFLYNRMNFVKPVYHISRKTYKIILKLFYFGEKTNQTGFKIRKKTHVHYLYVDSSRKNHS